jgi:hypothetical protein
MYELEIGPNRCSISEMSEWYLNPSLGILWEYYTNHKSLLLLS